VPFPSGLSRPFRPHSGVGLAAPSVSLRRRSRCPGGLAASAFRRRSRCAGGGCV